MRPVSAPKSSSGSLSYERLPPRPHWLEPAWPSTGPGAGVKRLPSLCTDDAPQGRLWVVCGPSGRDRNREFSLNQDRLSETPRRLDHDHFLHAYIQVTDLTHDVGFYCAGLGLAPRRR